MIRGPGLNPKELHEVEAWDEGGEKRKNQRDKENLAGEDDVLGARNRECFKEVVVLGDC